MTIPCCIYRNITAEQDEALHKVMMPWKIKYYLGFNEDEIAENEKMWHEEQAPQVDK